MTIEQLSRFHLAGELATIIARADDLTASVITCANVMFASKAVSASADGAISSVPFEESVPV